MIIEATTGHFLSVDIEGLTKKENDTVALKILGKDRSEIAEQLCVSEETVKQRLSVSYQKTEVSGTPNPLAALQCKAFALKWIRLLMVFLVVSGQVGPRSNTQRIGQARMARTAREVAFLNSVG